MRYETNISTGEVTEHEDAPVIAAPPVPPTVIEQLAKLDADNTLTQRNLRETIMLMNEAFKLVSNNAVDLSNIPGVAQVYAVEAQAAVLRGQL
jgi:F420-0:gamma-glutamyl ligase-like protein